ncbi:MAG: SusC/RagA family TonB-linked outer membrane protein [Bacteroidota bacterium]
MHLATMKRCALLLLAIFGFTALSLAQTVTGTVTDKKGEPLPGVTVTVKGTKNATSSNNSGVYTLNNVGADAVLVFTGAGISRQETAVGGQASVNASLETSVGNLNEVVVVGYGTARRKDLTGSVATVQAKDFNKGIQTSPDQLIQGKVAGVQIINNSGMPGGSTTIRIRGASSIRAGNQPLFVIDGVPIDNTSARPGGADIGVGDKSQGGNPLNFINPSDIASIDVLKDASATAIFGSRGANGVVLVTTKKGQTGAPKIEFNASVGMSKVLKKLRVLNAGEYRAGLAQYNLGTANDEGADVDAFDAITRTGITQNYGVAISAGNEGAKYRLSMGYLDQEGIVRKTNFKKYSANLSGSFRFLESKALGLDVNIIVAQTLDNQPPISNNSGFRGSLIGQALQWNPTKPLRKVGSDSLNVNIGGDVFNPLASSEAVNDLSKVSTILASIAPSFKITKDLEYKLILSANYGTGNRKTWIANFINYNDPRPIQRQVNAAGVVTNAGGYARLANNETNSLQVTNTLTYTKNITSTVNLRALIGTEYLKYNNRNSGMNATGFANVPYPYYDYFQSTDPTQIRHEFYVSPTSELQSYFGRVDLNLSDKYLFTATLRRDGSSKFGENNKYGNFPSFGAAWNMSKESFLKNDFISNLKLRVGWGKVGNQEFPAGASQRRYNVGFGSVTRDQLENPDLKWETSTTTNAGLDFTIFNNKVSGSIDYFRKSTKDILFLKDAADPVIGGGKKWVNLPGEVLNSGVEIALNTTIINNNKFNWEFGVNATFLKNILKNFGAPLETGEINGQGLSEVRSQLFTTDQPLNVFYLKTFEGIDKDGIGIVKDQKTFVGDPNPNILLGISTRASYGKWGLEVNMNGAFGHQIYNNTANAVLTINNLGIGRNTTPEALAAGESLASPISASTRYLESGSYVKLANATLSYRLGNIKFVKGANIFVTGQNLLVFTGYSGFDPEVNTDKTYQDLPSFGIEYTPYPSARSVTFGVNFSF